MKKVLVTPRSFGKNDPTLFDQLKAGGFEVVRNDTGAILSEETICRMIADCDAVILGVDPCNKNVLDHAPKLRAIARYGVGLDNIDLEECKKRGISVTRTVGANSNAVADFAFGLMLAVARKIVLIDNKCRKQDWSKNTGIDVFGKTLGIIGLGAVGKCVARRAAGFGMKILAADPYFDDKFAQDLGIARASVDDNGKIIVCTDLHKAIEACNIIAPEHLEVCVEDPFGVLNEIKNAGSIFLGRNVPEALGDYFAGPNHTLPTSGTARFSSPLSVDDFVKKSSFLYYTQEALAPVAERIADFARREGLEAHARSALIRTNQGGNPQ